MSRSSPSAFRREPPAAAHRSQADPLPEGAGLRRGSPERQPSDPLARRAPDRSHHAAILGDQEQGQGRSGIAIYRWEGKLQDGEFGLLLKTRRPLVERATARIKALRDYIVPCIVALPVVGGNPGFLAWIGAET